MCNRFCNFYGLPTFEKPSRSALFVVDNDSEEDVIPSAGPSFHLPTNPMDGHKYKSDGGVASVDDDGYGTSPMDLGSVV